MDNNYILTPFFIERPMSGLEPLLQPDWQINQPEELPPGPALATRASARHRPEKALVSRETWAVGR